MLYTLGNAQKNQLLLNMYNKLDGNQPYTFKDITIPRDKFPSIMKYILLVKELGDVLQIMEYYGIVTFLEDKLSIDNAKTHIRPKFNMQTTDSVVFDLCVSLELPCTYTGSREGVEKGGITVIMYEYEETPPKTILQNRLTSIYHGLHGRLNSLTFGITTGLARLSSLYYVIPENYTAPGKKPTRSSTIATGEQVRPLEAHSFYSHDNIMFNALKMASDNSVQLKKKVLSELFDAVNQAKVALKEKFDSIVMYIDTANITSDNLITEMPDKTTELQEATKIIFREKEIGFDDDPIVKVKQKNWIIRNPILVEWFAYYSGYFPEDVAARIKSTNTIKFNDNGEYNEITTGGDGKKLLNPTGKKLLNPTRKKLLNPMGKKLLNPTRKKLLNPTRKKKSLSFFKKKTLQQKGGGNTGNLTLENCIYLKEAIDHLQGNQHDPALLSLTFSEIQYQSRVNPKLYRTLLLKFGGYIGDDDNELLRASERERDIRERERDQREIRERSESAIIL